MSDVLDATTKPLKLSKNERVMMYHKISLENRLATYIYFSYMLDLLIFKYLANRYIFKIDIVMYLMSSCFSTRGNLIYDANTYHFYARNHAKILVMIVRICAIIIKTMLASSCILIKYLAT